MKFVRVWMGDGSAYDVPLQVVQEKLAVKAASDEADKKVPEGRLRNPKEYDQVYTATYKEALATYKACEHADLFQRAAIDLAWKIDVEPYAVKYSKPDKIDLSSGWTQGFKEVVEK